MNKKIVALIIFSTSVVVSFFILQNNEAGNTRNTTEISQADKKSPSLQFEKQASILSAAKKQLTPNPEDEANLTKEFAKLYTSKILEQNPGTGERKVVPPNIEDIIAVTSDEFGRQKLEVRTLSEKDIRVTPSSSKEAHLAYITALGKSWEKNFKNIPSISLALNEWALKKNTKPLEKYVSAIPSHVTTLLEVSVPKNWKQFHIENINLWERRLSIYEALLNMDRDPMLAMVALYELEAMNETDYALQSVLSNEYTKLLNS